VGVFQVASEEKERYGQSRGPGVQVTVAKSLKTWGLSLVLRIAAKMHRFAFCECFRARVILCLRSHTGWFQDMKLADRNRSLKFDRFLHRGFRNPLAAI